MNKHQLSFLLLTIAIVGYSNATSFISRLMSQAIDHPQVILPVRLHLAPQDEKIKPMQQSTIAPPFLHRLLFPDRINLPEVSVPLRFSVAQSSITQSQMSRMIEAGKVPEM